MDSDLVTEGNDCLNNELIEAAKSGSLEAVNTCLQKGALINYVDQSDNWTALHYASVYGHRDIVSILLDNGSDINMLSPDGWSLLHFAAYYGHKGIVSDLLYRGLKPNIVTRTHGVSVLHCAVENGQKEIVSELLDNDCDPYILADFSRTVLHWAAENGKNEIVSVLLDKELNLLYYVDENGWLALHLAAQNGHRDSLSELLCRGSYVNAATPDGTTALHLASMKGHKEVVTVLLNHAADINATTTDGSTALHLSSSNGQMEVVTVLLDKTADPNVKDKDGYTPLHQAARHGYKELVTILLDHAADPNTKATNGKTALHYAAYDLRMDIVSKLVEKGAEVYAMENYGGTALDLISDGFFVENNRQKEMKSFLQEEKQKVDLLQQLRGLGLETASDLQDLIQESSFKSFWNRVYLVGPYSVGKSCLAKILVGEPVPDSRESTDGIWIYFGRAGMDVDEMKWIYFEKGNAVTEILTHMLMTLSSAEITVDALDSSANDHTKQNLLETKRKCSYQVMKVDNDPQRGLVVDAEALMPTVLSQMSHKESGREDADTIEDLQSSEGFTLDDHSTDNQLKGTDVQCSPTDEMKSALMFDSNMKNLLLELPKMTERNRSTTQAIQIISGQLDSEWMKEISSNMSTDKLHELMVKAVQEEKYKQMIVPIDIWDFGGQKDYHMTHQLFITSRGIFILMFNGSIGIHKHRPDLGFLPGHFGKPTIAVYLLHWVNSILTFCKRTKEGFPKIIFVASHKDRISFIWKWRFESYRRKLEDKIQKVFESHAGLKHLEFKPLLFINSTNPEDPEIKELQQRLMKRATEHPRWGEEMPTAWIPLDLQLTMKVEEGTNIISILKF